MKQKILLLFVVMAASTGIAFAHGEGARFVEVATTLLGHPAHPIFVVFPLGLFPTALLFDLIYLWRRDAFWSMAAFYVLLVGLLGALVAASLGFIDYFSTLPSKGDLRGDATTHWYFAVAAAVVIGANILWRWKRDATEGAGLGIATALSVIGVALILTAGFYGGHLVFEERVGVVKPGHEHKKEHSYSTPATGHDNHNHGEHEHPE